MFDLIQAPIFSSWLGWLSILFVIGLNGVLAFLAFTAYHLRAREWPVVSVCFVLYALFNLLIPPAAIRNFQNHQSSPPADALRVGFLLLGLVVGLHALWSWMKERGMK